MGRILSISDSDHARVMGHTAQAHTREAIDTAAAVAVDETLARREDVLAPYRRQPDDQSPRERRLRREEVPLLAAVKLSWGLEVSLLNISSTGMLIETTSKFTPGSVTEFQLSGPNTNLTIPARFVRSEVAGVDARSVKYHAAAVFARGLHLPTFLGADQTATPKALAGLLADVLTDVEHAGRPSTLRAKFEQGLRQLVSARDIQIREALVMPRHGDESLYFTVPSTFGSVAILQATFEPGRELAENEVKLLRSAATLAAAVLEFENMS